MELSGQILRLHGCRPFGDGDVTRSDVANGRNQIMEKKIIRGILVGALALAGIITTSSSASAHASIQLYGEQATPGGYGVLFIRIPHGCTGGLTTDKVVVSIPAGFASVRPQLVAGFTAGRTMSGTTVTEVQWSGGALKNSEFTDFGVSVRYPLTAGSYGLKVVQHCGAVTTTWDGADLPTLVVAPNTPSYPITVEATEHDGAMKMIFDASTIHAGKRVAAYIKVDGNTVRKMGVVLDERGDAKVSVAMRGTNPKGEKYRILDGAVVEVAMNKTLVGMATLGKSTSSVSGGGH